LEELSWPQLNVTSTVFNNTDEADVENATSRVVSIFQFKRACALPNLKKLYLCSKSCKLKPIRKFAGPLMGIYEASLTPSINDGGLKGKCDLEYSFDRKIFSYEFNNLPTATTTNKSKRKL
jgi:hypothetical protein